MAKAVKWNRSHSSKRKKIQPMIHSVTKMKRFALLTISLTLLVARNRRRLIIQTTTLKLSLVPLLPRGKTDVRTVQRGKIGAMASARDLQSQLVLLVRRELIRTKCNQCMVLQVAKGPSWTITAVRITGTISMTTHIILQCRTACPKW